jgi:MFS family permease
MFARLRFAYHTYPGQFWLMFVGMFLSTVGTSMIWPFLMIYVSRTLDVPMAVAASLLTVQSITGITVSFLGGPLLDRVGRKWIMVFSLAANGAAYIFLGHAATYIHFAILLALTGAVNPLYRAGADAMMADLVPPKQRADAYSMMRLSNNLGISIGPVIGGMVASTSYTIAFYAAAAGMILYGLLLALRARETLPALPGDAAVLRHVKERFGGYPAIFRDGPFMGFIGTFTLAQICAILMWTLMPVYVTTNFGVTENVYKWIPATNAIMVVALQQLITQFTKHRPPLQMMAIGSLIYALSVGGVGLSTGFWGFWLCMVAMTIGEMILVPTSSTYTANLAPADKRGRYMSIYGLSWPVGQGTGPVVGGLLSDTLGPQSTWFGGMAGGLISVLIFAYFGRRAAQLQPAAQPPAAD